MHCITCALLLQTGAVGRCLCWSHGLQKWLNRAWRHLGEHLNRVGRDLKNHVLDGDSDPPGEWTILGGCPAH